MSEVLTDAVLQGLFFLSLLDPLVDPELLVLLDLSLELEEDLLLPPGLPGTVLGALCDLPDPDPDLR